MWPHHLSPGPILDHEYFLNQLIFQPFANPRKNHRNPLRLFLYGLVISYQWATKPSSPFYPDYLDSCYSEHGNILLICSNYSKEYLCLFLFKTLMWLTAVLRMESKHLGMGFRPCSELPELVRFPYHFSLCASVVLSCMDVQASTLTSYLGGGCFLCTSTPLPFSVNMLLLILQVLAHESSFPGCCPGSVFSIPPSPSLQTRIHL